MTNRHIIQVSSYYPPHLGGQENAVQGLAQQLAAAGNTVQVLTSTQGGAEPGAQQEGGVEITRLKGFVFGHAPIMPRFAWQLLRAAKPGSVVHVHIGQAFTPEMVWLASKLRRFPYIAQLHIDFEPSGPASILLPLYKRFVLKPVLRSAAAVVTLNKKTLRTVRTTYGFSGRAHILPNGIDETYFALKRPKLAATPPKTLRLLFVGRLSKQKNIVELLKALKITKRRATLDIIGDGEERQIVQKTIKKLGLKNVTMHGRLSREAVLPFYKTCHALIMPSLYEAQPLVLLEAMAARIPIIGTNVIGVAEHIKNAGIIVEPTAPSLARGIKLYDQQYDNLATFVNTAHKKATTYRWQPTIKKYEALYHAVANN